MNFYEKEGYSITDIEYLIKNEVEESIHLDYKAAGALTKEDNKRTEITKDVSSFANSDGGIIIYGVSEKDHRPSEISPINGRVFTKEWIENVFQLIQPRIENLIVYPIRIADLDQSIYVVKIPRSDDAPHMARDKRYYKRFNFKAEPMDDYEVKDLFNRITTPKLRIEGCTFSQVDDMDNEIVYELKATIVNNGKQACDRYKLNFYINDFRFCDILKGLNHPVFSYTVINRNRLKLSINSQEAIYPQELLDIGHIRVSVNKIENRAFWENLVIDMILFYSGGQDELAFVPSSREYVENRESIDRLLKSKE